MATSYSRRVAFRPTHEAEEDIFTGEYGPHHRDDPRIRKEKPPISKSNLVSFHRAPDRHSFAHLAKVLVSGERTAMLDAVDRLKGRTRILVELACFSNFQFVRLAAISNLNGDSEALADIAKYCQYEDTRAAAVDDLASNKESLIDIACSALFKDTRLHSVSLLSDSHALAKVASHSPNADSRGAAVEKLSSNPAALKKVSEDSPYKSTRADALRSLASDVAALASLVIHARHPDVKKSAASMLSEHVEELEDVETLTEIAKISPNADSRYLAMGRLWQHPWALRKVFSESRFKDARSTALMLLSDMVPKLDDADLLAEVAMLSPYRDCRAAAIDRLVGQSNALLTVASKSKFRDARQLALDKLKGDVTALKSVSRLSKYKDTRAQAHKIVAQPQTFEAELTRILGGV